MNFDKDIVVAVVGTSAFWVVVIGIGTAYALHWFVQLLGKR